MIISKENGYIQWTVKYHQISNQSDKLGKSYACLHKEVPFLHPKRLCFAQPNYQIITI